MRSYDPGTGRFVSEDFVRGTARKLPNGQEIPEPLSLHRYAYCHNNLVLYSDPSGEFVITTAFLLIAGGALLFGAIGGAVGNHMANRNGATGWDKVGYIAGGVAIGAAVGAAIGWGIGAAVSAISTAAKAAAVAAVNGEKIVDAVGQTISNANTQEIYKTIEEGVNFTKTTLARMNNPARFVPVQTLIEAIKNGVTNPDPQGSKAIMYTIEMVRNSKVYMLEVLYDMVTNTIFHFLYK